MFLGFNTVRLLLFIFIITSLYTCATRKIMRGGIAVPYKKVLKEDFQRCERANLEGHYEDAKACFIKFTKEFSDSRLIDDAHFALGSIYYKQNNFQEASLHFKKILTHYDYSDLLSAASFSLASCYFQRGEHRKSYIVLSKIDKDRASTPLKLKIYYLLARNAQNSGAYYSAVLWYLKAHDLSSKKKNITRINNEVIRIIEEHLTKSELLSLADRFSNRFPSAYINYRLGKNFYDSLNPDQAKYYLDRLMRDKDINSIESHYISDAGDLLARIESHEKIIKNRIGVILPLSGKFKRYGLKALKGIELSAGIYNNKSSTFEVELVIADSKNDPNIAASAVKKLLFKNHVSSIIGPLLSATAQPVATTCEKLGIPSISLSQRSGIPEIGEYTFRLALTNPLQVRTLTKYAIVKLGITKFAILHSRDDYGKEMANLFWDEVLKNGGEITDIEGYNPGQTDFKDEIARISDRYYASARIDELNSLRTNFEERMGRRPRRKEVILPPNINFEAIFIPSFPKDIGQIAPALSYGDVEGITLLGTNGWNSKNLLKRGGEFVEGAIFVDGFFANSPYSVVRDFSTTYYNTFKRSPGIIEAHANDATDILISILSQENIETRSEIQKALLQIRNFPGVTGSITFSETGDAEKPLFILTVENENIIQVN